MNEVMVSQFYELTDDMRDMGELDFREEYLYDPRLRSQSLRHTLCRTIFRSCMRIIFPHSVSWLTVTEIVDREC